MYNADVVKPKHDSKTDAPFAQGSTALQWASAGGSIEVVKWLIKQAGAEVDYRNKVGTQPVHVVSLLRI